MANEARHTVGDWQARSNYTLEDRLTIIANVDGEYIDGKPRGTFDVIAQCMDEFGEALPNAEDNARLIIAAPKMLKVLQAIKTYGELACVSVDHGHIAPSGKKPATKDVWQFPRHMLVEIDAAITKATTPTP